MHQLLIRLMVLSFASLGYAARAMKQVENVANKAFVTQGWHATRDKLEKEEIKLEIGLTLQNTATMVDELLQVSNPESHKYGKWLERDEVNAMVEPSRSANTAVVEWLRSEGVQKIVNDGTWIAFVTDIETANRILHATFRRYERNGVQKIRTVKYSVPEDVFDYIDIIHPTTFFGRTEPLNSRRHHRNDLRTRQPQSPGNDDDKAEVSSDSPGDNDPNPGPQDPVGPMEVKPQLWPFKVDSRCKKGLSPGCIKQMYNIQYIPNERSGSRIGFSSFLNQSANIKDALTYQELHDLPIRNFTKVFINEAANNQDPSVAQEMGGEAGLDVISGLVNPLPITEFLTGGRPPFHPDLEMKSEAGNTNEPYLPFIRALASKQNSAIPQVISISYGEPEQTVPIRYARRTCQILAQLGLRGITVVASSGDSGIGSYCQKNDGTKQPTYLPQFPASCPFITSIGGTEGLTPEIAWRDSSGGFSNYFKQPEYQQRAVHQYLYEALPRTTALKHTTYINSAGRAFPDISAHSLDPMFQIILGGRPSFSGGTSAAAPVVASIIALLNDARLRSNLSTLGFINPWLYSRGSEFLVDIIQGAARGCDGINHETGQEFSGSSIIPGAYWNSTVGWDAATGLGVFNFQKALAMVL